MSQREKLIERIRQRPPQADFSDVAQLLELFGWICARQKGSHRAFTKPGQHTIIVPIKRGKVARVYLDQICGRLGLDD
jgi:predicted RNA binding protein YcfA (HicA-like mRNA interferase family)